jgi:hypothetical protein
MPRSVTGFLPVKAAPGMARVGSCAVMSATTDWYFRGFR